MFQYLSPSFKNYRLNLQKVCDLLHRIKALPGEQSVGVETVSNLMEKRPHNLKVT